jgi:hypothetical protein
MQSSPPTSPAHSNESPPSSPPSSPSPIALSLSSSSGSPHSTATVLTPSRGTINWSRLLATVHQIQRFLLSLDADAIGTGFVCYKEEEFFLIPGSSWTNNHTYQWWVNRGDDNATFEGVMGAFIELKNKVDGLKNVIDQFTPNGPDDCSDEVQELSLKLIDLQMNVTQTAINGLKRLYENYESSWNKEKTPITLYNKGISSFEILKVIEGSLFKKIVRYRPDFELNVKLRQDHPHADILIGQRDQYRETISATVWVPERGTVISENLILQTLNDVFGRKPIRVGLKIAAKSLQLPRLAQPIHPHRTKYAWVPIRPEIDEDGQITLQEGVYGTCERSPKRSHTVCNLYYVFYEDAQQLVLGCGAIDNRKKAKQVVALLVRELNKCASGRVVIHQLNSWFNETHLIRDVHSQAGFINEQLETLIPAKKVRVLHFNTAFNAATKVPIFNEDFRSVNEINIDSLALLLQCVHEDLHLLIAQSQTTPDTDVDFLKDLVEDLEGFALVETNPPDDHVSHPDSSQPIDPPHESEPIPNRSHPLVFDLLSILSEKCKSVLNLAEKIREGKQLLRNDAPAIQQPYRNSSSSSSSSMELSESLTSSSSAGISPARDGVDSSELHRDRLSSTPTPVRAISHQLKQNQLKLTEELNDVALRILPELIAFFEKCSEGSPKAPLAKKAILILSILRDIYQVQLKISGGVPHSRCSEIELFLLIYRLLNINPIITCWSGLDRSGYVRALADSQIEMERIIVERMMQENPDLDLSLAKVIASEQIFRMIQSFDQNREILFVETKNVFASHQIVPAIDKISWDSSAPTQINIKEKLFEVFAQKGLPPSELQLLRDTEDYLELVNRHLIVEILRTEASTGASGLKYHHSKDAYWFDPQIEANPHVLQRVTFFIQTESGKYIQMLNYSPPLTRWSYPTISFTNLGMWLIERNSQLRGS